MFYDFSVLHLCSTIELLGFYIINLKTIYLNALRVDLEAGLCVQIANLNALSHKNNLVGYLI